MNERPYLIFFSILVVAGVALGLAAVVTDRTALDGPVPPTLAAERAADAARASAHHGGEPMTAWASGDATGVVGSETTASSGTARTASGAVLKPGFYPDRPADMPASFGEPLDVVTVPPPDTIALVGSIATTVGATYVVDFAPYGYAGASGGLQDPGGPSNATALIIKVVEGVPRNAAAARMPLSQKNLLVQLTPSTTGKVTTGGWYRGNIVFVQRPTGLVPALTFVYVPKKQ